MSMRRSATNARAESAALIASAYAFISATFTTPAKATRRNCPSKRIVGGIESRLLDRCSDAAVRLAPAIFVHELGQVSATDGAELPHGIADRKNRVRVHARREPEGGLALLLVEEMPRRQRGAEPERARREQHVLHRRIDRRA